jgi:hypothetical protein
MLGSSNKVSLRIHLGLESLFVCSESLETDLSFVWNSLKVTGTVGIVLSPHLLVWVLCKELGNGTHYCLLLSMLGIGIHLALENPSNLLSFVLIAAKLYITALLCFLLVPVYSC